MTTYRTVPDRTSRMPGGIPYIIGNELAERFSFYGMNAILTIFLAEYLMNGQGELDPMSDEESKSVFHLFKFAAYFTPILGAMIADIFLGKYKTIVTLSLLYCVGHGFLAMMDIAPHFDTHMAWFMYPGLLLIAMGAGAIKPCVSAHVGDQFGTDNKHLVPKIFAWFYFSINIGAATSTILTPIFLDVVGPWLAFGVPGVLMAIATLVFWLGRHKFVHVPAAGWRRFREETFSPEGKRAMINLAPIFLIFIPMFWALFDQTSSAWVLQAISMDRNMFGHELLPSQIQAANPILILILIPVFAYGVYPAISKVFPLTPLRKISIGLFVAAGAFAISAWIESQIAESAGVAAANLWQALGTTGPNTVEGLRQAIAAARQADLSSATLLQALDGMPHIGWQILAYVAITAAEVMVSITSLEFAYTQAPRKMKSFIMGVYFLGVSLGNLFVSGVNVFIQNEDGTTKLDGAAYYWFFTGMMVATALIFVVYSQFYKGQTYIQGEGVEALCRSCGQSLRGIKSDQCPECGTPIDRLAEGGH